jgi:twitching motility protein PilT
MVLERILNVMVEKAASDVYVKVGSAPVFRVNGVLQNFDLPVTTDREAEEMVKQLMTDHQRRRFEDNPDLDLAYTAVDGHRYRVNAFRQKGHLGLVIRLVRMEDLTFERLNLPPVVQRLAELPRGLVLVTGATGSGKSTTLAAMIRHINNKFKKHVMTIEDPIEFMHDDKLSVINQREVGFDTNSFADALKHVVRQSPDVILVGEMRDLDTMITALSAAQTGHLVLSTMHTTDVTQTLDRMINYFPEHLRPQIRLELSLCLEGVVCMRLLPRRDRPGRIPALEIMLGTPAIKKLLFSGETWRILDLVKQGRDMGMQTFNQALVDLYREGKVSYDDALLCATSPEEFKLNAQGIYTGVESITEADRHKR